MTGSVPERRGGYVPERRGGYVPERHGGYGPERRGGYVPERHGANGPERNGHEPNAEFVLVTPDAGFEEKVKLAFDGEVEYRRFWDGALPRLHPHQAVESIEAPEASVVVIGPEVGTAEAIDLAAAFDQHRPDVCTVLVAKPTPKTFELALRAGARDVIAPGIAPPELRGALARAAETAVRRRTTASLRASDSAPGRVITVLGAKGGSGKTMVATNLAVALSKGAPGKVVVADFDLQFGDVSSALSVTPRSTISDAARANGSLTATALKVFLEPHPGGFYVLCAPLFPAEADDVAPATVGRVLGLLADEFEYVIVDTGAGLDEWALAAAERSSDLIFVCATDVPSVRSTRKALDALDLLGMTASKRLLLLNRADARVGLTKRDIEATVGLPVDIAVPSSRSVPISVNQGLPVVGSDPRSPVAKALTELAYRFLVASSEPVPARPAWG